MIGRRGAKTIGAIALLTFALIVAGVTYVRMSYNAAELRAKTFCGEVTLGEAISVATAKAERERIHYSSQAQYQFYFPFNMGFDRAVCNVLVDERGKVLSKNVEMEMD